LIERRVRADQQANELSDSRRRFCPDAPDQLVQQVFKPRRLALVAASKFLNSLGKYLARAGKVVTEEPAYRDEEADSVSLPGEVLQRSLIMAVDTI
jgi:hypothetical protein